MTWFYTCSRLIFLFVDCAVCTILESKASTDMPIDVFFFSFPKVAHFKDFIPQAFPGGQSMILDSEVLLIDNKTGKPLPFGTLGVHKVKGGKKISFVLGGCSADLNHNLRDLLLARTSGEKIRSLIRMILMKRYYSNKIDLMLT